MKKLRQISVIGLGLLGSSVTLTISRSLAGVKTVGYSHRGVTREKARQLGVVDEVCDDIETCVREADMVILATPVCTFEGIFREIAPALPDGAIVTDVGSVKVLPHRWAERTLSRKIYYVGSHPIAGSEKRGVEFGRDDLFANSRCIVTKSRRTNAAALGRVRRFWQDLGCSVNVMTPAEHDRIFGRVSHVPHVTAVALVNAGDSEELKYAGKGFIDTSRVASGPANVWTDILMTNAENISRGIDAVIRELNRIQRAVLNKDAKAVERILSEAGAKRAALIKYKVKNKELL
ncbi:MAG TPA: prephenate dehydrogenase [Anaerohalosphaeraceae bacterium]|nr:prephenate dehydrogenase [Anaerohalosphaeraceae bacterium]HRT87877.1 prephenate dehydrogenase [Anaerohalosphaeraceae bacterium]